MSFKGKTINLKVIVYNSGTWLAIFVKHDLRFDWFWASWQY